jgi:prevent-host-death family protein
MSKAMSVAAAKAHFSECVKLAEAGQAVVITRHGKAVAAVVGTEELEELRRRRAEKSERGGLLALVDLEGMDELAEELEQVVAQRSGVRDVVGFE